MVKLVKKAKQKVSMSVMAVLSLFASMQASAELTFPTFEMTEANIQQIIDGINISPMTMMYVAGAVIIVSMVMFRTTIMGFIRMISGSLTGR